MFIVYLKLLVDLQNHHFHIVQMRIHFSVFKIHRCIKVTLSQRLMYPMSNLSVKEGSKSGFP
jgi:hypothetical protein